MVLAAIRRNRQNSAKGVANWRHMVPPVAVFVAVFGLTSCAVSPSGDGSGAPVSSEARRQAVEVRASARWDALIKGDLDRAYALLSPASREATTLEQFKNNTRKGAFREAKVEQVECSSDACTVKLRVTYDHRLMKGVTTPVVETWVFDKGQAWMVYRG
jgi:hypothetical protein